MAAKNARANPSGVLARLAFDVDAFIPGWSMSEPLAGTGDFTGGLNSPHNHVRFVQAWPKSHGSNL